jgi:hypothetical protein
MFLLDTLVMVRKRIRGENTVELDNGAHRDYSHAPPFDLGRV